MPCDTKLKPQQTIQQRVAEVRRVVEALSAGLASGKVKVKIGPQGAVAFEGLSDADRDGVTDVCAFRRVMISGSALAKAAIARAEQIAGRGVSRQVLAAGVHSHDGGATWHNHKG